MRLVLLVAIVFALLLFLVIDLAERAVEPTPATVKTAQQWGRTAPPYVIDAAMFTTTTTQPRPRSAPTRRFVAVSSDLWDALARCESGGRWDDQRGGYEGGVHFLHSTWVKAGGRRFAEHAYQATREQQIEVATEWLARTSWSQWPVCSRKVGAR